MKRHEICGFCHQFAGGLIGLVSQPLSGKAGSSLGFAEVSSCPNFTFVYARFQNHVHTDERLAHIAPPPSSLMNPAASTRLIPVPNGYSRGLTRSSRRFAEG